MALLMLGDCVYFSLPSERNVAHACGFCHVPMKLRDIVTHIYNSEFYSLINSEVEKYLSYTESKTNSFSLRGKINIRKK
jgi:hypothetical protein